MTSADSVRVAYPLFQEEGGGSIPTSALQLNFGKISLSKALGLNELWHSILPERLPINHLNFKHGLAFGAEFNAIFYATAIWSTPIAISLDNGKNFELRRMAISSDAPKNTASRFLGFMIRKFKHDKKYEKLISYQDTEAHKGTIYKASGWRIANVSSGNSQWYSEKAVKKGKRVPSNPSKRKAPKIRWEYLL